MSHYIALICARGGSKGLPGKNIRPLAGKPLVGRAIETAAAVKRISRIIVSTDSEEIASVARAFGAEVPFMRPAELSRDDSPEWLAWRHALNFLKETTGAWPDALVSVPATAPMRLPVDVERCIDEFGKGEADIVITMTDANRNPYFNMVRRNSDGTVGLVVAPSTPFSRRQDAPVVYDMTTVAYVFRPEFVMTKNALFEGRVAAVHVPPERALDIDTPLEFEFAEFLMARRKSQP
jgi:CMP-N-acetylneuraminic acid synthetase